MPDLATETVSRARLPQRRPWSARWRLIFVTVLSPVIALLSYRYFVVPGIKPPTVIASNTFLHPWLLVHVAGAATALLLGPLQFFWALKARFRQLHRWVGRVYALACTVGSISGFALSLGASTGWISSLGFGLLAICWQFTTGVAYVRISQGRVDDHRRWMIRSFALTFGAVTLRLYLAVVPLLPWSYDDCYRAITFLAWVPNQLVAEMLLSSARRQRAPGVA